MTSSVSLDIRRGFFSWLLPAALVLPAWLFIGWGLSGSGAWAFVWVLFMAVPSVAVGQLLATLLVRVRPSVRRERALSWADVGIFSLWHALIVVVGFFPQSWFALALLASIVVFVAVLVTAVTQLLAEGRAVIDSQAQQLRDYANPDLFPSEARAARDAEVIVIHESGDTPRG